MDPDSTVDNLICHYGNRPHQLENYCLADFASQVNLCLKTKTASNPSSKSSTVICYSQTTVYQRRKKDGIIRYVNYNKNKDQENHCRERLVLFLPWRDRD